jgi:quinol monooxygenase YgiN
MVTLIARWYVLEGKQAAAVTALKELASEVLSTEPNTLMYLVHTPDMKQASLPPPTDTEILFVEAYADMKSFFAHLNGPAFTNFVKHFGKLFQTATGTDAHGKTVSIPFVQVEFLNRQAGFVRESAAGAEL